MRFWLGPYQRDASVPWTRRTVPAGVSWNLDLSSLPECASTAARSGVGLFVTPDTVVLSAEYEPISQGDWDTAPQESKRAVVATLLGTPTVDGATLAQWIASALSVYPDPAGDTRVRPLMPALGQLELNLHGRVIRRPFDVNGANAAHVIDVKRRDYRAYRQDAIDGKMIGPNGPDPEFHRRWLTKTAEEWGVNNPMDVFIPGDLPRESPLPHYTSYAESFNKANAATLGPDLTWTEVVGTSWGVLNNEANLQAISDDSHARAGHDTSSSNQFAQFTAKSVTTPTGILAAGAMVRFSSSADTAYMWNAREDQALWAWAKWVAGVETYPLSSTVSSAFASNDVVRGEVSGSSLNGYKNAVSLQTLTDTSITTGSRAGIRGVITGTAVFSLDAFSFGDLSGRQQSLTLLGAGA